MFHRVDDEAVSDEWQRRYLQHVCSVRRADGIAQYPGRARAGFIDEPDAGRSAASSSWPAALSKELNRRNRAGESWFPARTATGAMTASSWSQPIARCMSWTAGRARSKRSPVCKIRSGSGFGSDPRDLLKDGIVICRARLAVEDAANVPVRDTCKQSHPRLLSRPAWSGFRAGRRVGLPRRGPPRSDRAPSATLVANPGNGNRSGSGAGISG